MTSLRPAWLEIDLDALAHNVRLHRRAAGPDCRFFAIVKGDGYGVGLVESARMALAAGADALALGNPDEVATLRQAGVSAPILLYASSLPEEAAVIADLGVIPTIHDEASLDALAAPGRELDVWVKLDCGVGRLGFLPGAAEAAFRRLAAARHLRLGGVYSRFRNPHDESQLRSQAAIFLAGCAAATNAGFTGFERMVASSRVVLGAPDLRLTAINPGKALYGYVDASWPQDDIRPIVAALKARVIMVKDHPPSVVLYGDDRPLASPRRRRAARPCRRAQPSAAMRRAAGRRTPCAYPEPTRHRAYRDRRHASAAGRDRRRSRRARASGLGIDQRGGDRGHHGRRHAGTRGAPRPDGAPAISAGSRASGAVRGCRMTPPGPRKGNP
jgi:alanine racemase